MIVKVVAAAAVAAALAGITKSAQALDTALATPSAQVSETLPVPRVGHPVPQTPVERPAANSNNGNAGYLVVPLGRQRDRNAQPVPWSRGDSDNDGVPNNRDHAPSDPDHQ